MRVKLTPPPVLWREKRPPCGIGLTPKNGVLNLQNKPPIRLKAKIFNNKEKQFSEFEPEFKLFYFKIGHFELLRASIRKPRYIGTKTILGLTKTD